jgi:Late competence development protein ComFB
MPRSVTRSQRGEDTIERAKGMDLPMPESAMYIQFESVQNYNEELIFRSVSDCAVRYPMCADDPELLADVACVALNHLPPRYIRHTVDMRFFMSDEESAKIDAAVTAAVEFAFGFVESRERLHPRR